MKNGIFIHLDLWEDYIDAMSKTRLQDEYNKSAANSDIFVSLFFKKIGKYTLEEFEKAFGEFKSSGKPLIYTYFKKRNHKKAAIQTDTTSRNEFVEKLKSLGHFPTEYRNIEDLKYQFKSQLEKLIQDRVFNFS